MKLCHSLKLLSSIILVILLSSCVKNHTCICNTESNNSEPQTTFKINATKKKARAICNEKDEVGESYSRDCELGVKIKL